MRNLDEVVITKAIVDTYHQRFMDDLDIDVAIAGGGPAGLMAAYKLAKAGRKVALYERKLSIGGGMWGGGIGCNVIVVQEEGRALMEELGVPLTEYAPGYYTASSIDTVATLIQCAMRAGASMYNLYSVEDVMINDGRIGGVVLNKSPIELAGLHVDPICVRAKYVIEATGHPLEVLHRVQQKCAVTLATPSGKIEGERSMNATLAEQAVVQNTIEITPGLYVAGMAANAAMGTYRMGAVFGGMLLSGAHAAMRIHESL